MTGRIELLPRDGHAEFAGHIEAGSRGKITIDLDARKIVYRIPATLNKSKNSIQAAFAPRNPKSRTRLKAKLRQSDNISQIETAEARVVGNIEKDGVLLDRGNWHLAFRPRLFLGSENRAPLL